MAVQDCLECNESHNRVLDLEATLKEVESAVHNWMDFGERPCQFCGHHHLHDARCVYRLVRYTLDKSTNSGE